MSDTKAFVCFPQDMSTVMSSAMDTAIRYESGKRMNEIDFWKDLHNANTGEYSEGYDDGFWDAFSMITSVDYGKERFFLQDDGRVYDREIGDYYENNAVALGKYLEEIAGRYEC